MRQNLPLYNCHKQVRAVRIAEIKPHGIDGEAVIVPADPNCSPFTVSQAYMLKHEPSVGGYYVLYKDGYQSFSPAQAFEEGYTLAEE